MEEGPIEIEIINLSEPNPKGRVFFTRPTRQIIVSIVVRDTTASQSLCCLFGSTCFLIKVKL